MADQLGFLFTASRTTVSTETVAEEPTPAPTPLPRSKRLDAAVRRHLGAEFKLVLTDAKTVLLSSSSGKARVHQMFLDGDEDLMDAVGRFLKSGDKAAARLIDDFVAQKEHLLDPTPDVAPEDAIGACFDLRAVFDVLNRRYFEDGIVAEIAWGKRNAPVRGQSRESITLGSYDYRGKLITIHPVLDQRFVPVTVVGRVVHHEMCHARHPAEQSPGGRRIVHTRPFRDAEALYDDADGADAWLDENLKALLRWKGDP
jgi:hypothetical protein